MDTNKIGNLTTYPNKDATLEVYLVKNSECKYIITQIQFHEHTLQP